MRICYRIVLSGLLVFGITGTMTAQQRLCYFGDSITEGWIDAELRPAEAWPALLDSMLEATGAKLETFRRAHGGETTTDALRRIDEEVLALRPDLTILAFGSNDMYVWDNPPAPRVPVEVWREQLRLLIRKLQGSGSRVLVLGMPPLDEHRFYGFVDSAVYIGYGGAGALQASYARAAHEVAREEGAEQLSLSAVFSSPASQLGFDGVHPSPAGHRAIAAALLSRIDPLLEQEKRAFNDWDFTVFPVPFHTHGSGYCSVSFPAAAGTQVRIFIHDASGRLIRKIVYFTHADGTHFVPWNGRGDDGTRAAPGAYTMYVQSSEFSRLRSILLM
jgi:lysophospholipase L1-like esterase